MWRAKAAVVLWAVPVVVCGSVAVGALLADVTQRGVLREDDMTSVTGTLRSVTEKGSAGGQLFLEFYVDETPIRFRVPVDWYGKSFDRRSFFAAVRPGARITFRVEKKKLADPDRPMLDPVPTVFVYELHDERRVYCNHDAAIQGKDWGRPIRLPLAAGTGLVAVVCGVGLGFALVGLRSAPVPAGAAAPAPRAAASPPRPLSGGRGAERQGVTDEPGYGSPGPR